MPRLSRYLIRLAFLNLWFGFALANILMIWKAKPNLLPPAVGGWILAHVSLLLIGWMGQLALGVSYWIFPRLGFPLTERGRSVAAYAAAISLNLGVWGYSLGLILGIDWLQGGGLGAQIFAVIAYAYHIVPRIRTTLTAADKKRG